MPFQETTAPMMRPHQVRNTELEIKRIDTMLDAPAFVRDQIQDPAELDKQRKKLRRDLETQAPQPYNRSEVDDAKRRHDELLARYKDGCLTQEELRKNPPGAVDKLLKHDGVTKGEQLELKNIRLRLFAGNDLDDGSGERDVANLERFRPHRRGDQLNMDNAQIPGQQIHLPPPGAGRPVVMNEEQSEVLKEVDPEVHDRMALLTNDQRAMVLAFVDHIRNQDVPCKPADPPPVVEAKPAPNPEPKKKARGKDMTPAERKAFGKQMQEFREAAKQRRLEQQTTED